MQRNVITDLYAAIDLIVDKLERQIRKYKTRVNRKFREREGVAAFFASVNKSDETATNTEEEEYSLLFVQNILILNRWIKKKRFFK